MPDNAFAHSNLSLVLRDAGELEDAAANARRAIALDARLAEAHDNLATILKQQGDLAAAAEASRNAINLNPDNPLFHCNLAETLLIQSDQPAAERSYRCALELAPSLVAALSGLGTLCLQQERWSEARAWLEKALAAGTEDPMVLNSLGHALFQLKDTQAAVDLYKRALVRKPDFGAAHYHLGLALESLGKKTAVDAFAAALHYGYMNWEGLDSLFRAATRFGMVDRVYAHALGMLENAECPHEILPSIIGIVGQACDFSAHDRAWNRIQELYRQHRVDDETTKNLLGFSLYPGRFSEDFVSQLHRVFGAAMETSLAGQQFSEYRTFAQDRPLRIGYLSPDLRKHSVGYFIQHVISNHDRNDFEIVCYSQSKESDEVTEVIRQHATRFHQVDQLDDDALAQRIHADGIHLLIDLAGHSMGNRLEVLARKPAPLQLTWIGYPSNTGLASVDYRITDPFADDCALNPGPERLLVLPESFLCFGSFPECDIDPLPPVVRNRFVTFASFNQLMKLTDDAIRVWAQILFRVPGARLRIVAPTADSEAVKRNLHDEFAKHGIDPERIDLRPRLPRHLDYIRAHNDVDVMLDTWPYNGFTITANALWMGVPVVTLAGNAHRQRGSFSMLKNIGIEETISWDEEAYISAAVRLARDPAALTDLRQRIVRSIRGSILCDAPRFTRQLEAALRRAWDEYAASVPTAAPDAH